MSDENEFSFTESLHRTWVQFLSDHGYRELAAILTVRLFWKLIRRFGSLVSSELTS
jgi:hypothetical protein